MKYLRAALPNLTVCLNIVMMVVLYLDRRNPMMGFLMGMPFAVLCVTCCLCSIASAVILYTDWRNRGKNRHDTRAK